MSRWPDGWRKIQSHFRAGLTTQHSSAHQHFILIGSWTEGYAPDGRSGEEFRQLIDADIKAYADGHAFETLVGSRLIAQSSSREPHPRMERNVLCSTAK
jgi:hypothetical protein